MGEIGTNISTPTLAARSTTPKSNACSTILCAWTPNKAYLYYVHCYTTRKFVSWYKPRSENIWCTNYQEGIILNYGQQRVSGTSYRLRHGAQRIPYMGNCEVVYDIENQDQRCPRFWGQGNIRAHVAFVWGPTTYARWSWGQVNRLAMPWGWCDDQPSIGRFLTLYVYLRYPAGIVGYADRKVIDLSLFSSVNVCGKRVAQASERPTAIY